MPGFAELRVAGRPARLAAGAHLGLATACMIMTMTCLVTRQQTNLRKTWDEPRSYHRPLHVA